MADELPIRRALVVTERAGAQKRLGRLLSLLSDAGINIEVVATPEDAAAQLLLAEGGGPQCVIIDATQVSDGLPRSIAPITKKVRDLHASLPHIAPVIVADDPPPTLVIEAFRAGAGDFVDLAAETGSGIETVLGNVANKYRNKLEQRHLVRELREIIEEFLRDLVKTERRSIDLEHQLAAKERGFAEAVNRLDTDREPVVLIIEDDREVADLLVDELERAGLATYAYVSGEDAVLDVAKLVKRNEPVDLALIDSRLPGIDGLEALRRMRHDIPDLPAILMTGFSDTKTAVNAADLGVVGYVLKPFDDINGLVARIKEQAVHSRDRGRERLYLDRIKQRHERALLGYRKIAAELDKLFD